ncbi:MAG: homocitrate synthase [Lachnospiraceae bacterium]|nr:homocitrate synthase [Lachnospiraceae bacterium]
MDKYNLLDCTLRDGGYINQWDFKDQAIVDMIRNLIEAGLDFIEVGYLNNQGKLGNSTQFTSIEKIQEYLPQDRKDSVLLAMADVQQFTAADLTEYTGNSIDGIRVVFYKYQIEEAMELAKAVKEKGYKLFMQPMVTIDYSIDEYAELVHKIAELNPYAVSIVDSFGYMLKEDFRKYFKILDNLLEKDAVVGFHSHNNMNLAFITAQDILEYNTSRRIVIDSSLYGMGRGAGNMNTELIANYYNMTLGHKYNIKIILDMISKYIMPIYQQRAWGYSPYLFITALYHCHPNYASYLLEEYNVSVSDFERFIHTIPTEMKTKCRKPYVLEMWERFAAR